MGGRRIWEKTVKCDDWSNATINVHITKSDAKQFRYRGEYHIIINPNRIGIDFDNFEDGSHRFVPNLSPSDLIQMINRIEILRHPSVRETLRREKTSLMLRVELTSSRKVDFDIGYSAKSRSDELRLFYEDPGVLDRFQIGRIDVKFLRELIKVLKEVFIEYNHYMNRALLLRETI